MVTVSFEHEGDGGILSVVTHFGTKHRVICEKDSDQSFRLGGSAVSEVTILQGLVLDSDSGKFRAFSPNPPHNFFDGFGKLSPEQWSESADRSCWIHEYYSLDVEGHKPGWIISRTKLDDANHIFVNLDVLDGGGNLQKRYRVCPFFGDYRVV